MEEIWKTIPEYPNYKVSNLGRVINIKKNKLMTITKHNRYCWVKLSRDNIPKNIRIHRLVAQLFIPNPNNYSCINHKDENKVNNSVDNLEWCTQLYNNIYRNKAITIGLKLRDSNPRKKAVQQILDGKVINTFKSIREAARFLGNANKDSNIISGLKTGNPRYGYIWKYVTI